jgi:hypothetical protein
MQNPLQFDHALCQRRFPDEFAAKIVTVQPMPDTAWKDVEDSMKVLSDIQLSRDKLKNDEFIAMKMLTRFKELKREDPKKPHPDIGWMLEILEVVREYDKS